MSAESLQGQVLGRRHEHGELWCGVSAESLQGQVLGRRHEHGGSPVRVVSTESSGHGELGGVVSTESSGVSTESSESAGSGRREHGELPATHVPTLPSPRRLPLDSASGSFRLIRGRKQ